MSPSVPSESKAYHGLACRQEVTQLQREVSAKEAELAHLETEVARKTGELHRWVSGPFVGHLARSIKQVELAQLLPAANAWCCTEHRQTESWMLL